MVFPRNQWYVAAYGREVGAGAARPHDLRRADRLLPHRGRTTSSRWPTAACTAGSRSRRAASTATGRVRLPRLHLRHRRRAAWPCPARSASRAPPGSPPTRWSSRTPSSGCGSATRRTPTRPRSRARPGWPTPRLDDRVAAWSRSTRGYEPARRQPAGPVPRDLPARRLHRHPGGRRDADHHRGRRGAPASSASAGTWTTPSARRSTPSPPASRAGSRAGRTSSTTPPCLYLLHSRIAPVGVLPDAGRRRPGRLPRRDRLRHHPVDRAPTYDFWVVARDFALDDEEVTDVPARATTAPSSCRTSTRSTCWSGCIAERARGLPGAEHQHRHRRSGRPPDPRPAGRARATAGRTVR